MNISVRPAAAKDGEMLFRWRNDPDTMAASRSTAPVSQEEHKRWMEFNVLYGYPQHLVMIAEDDQDHPLGVIRFDSQRSDVMKFEVSITMAPTIRGRGLAAPVLRQACSYMGEFTINAEVKRDNTASRKLFESCGFEEIGRSSGYLQFRKEPSR